MAELRRDTFPGANTGEIPRHRHYCFAAAGGVTVAD